MCVSYGLQKVHSSVNCILKKTIFTLEKGQREYLNVEQLYEQCFQNG